MPKLDIPVIRTALHSPVSDAPPTAAEFHVEQMGDAAFDWIIAEIRGERLTVAETTKGLRLLSMLTRQFCLPRKGELLDLTMALASSPTAHVDVRSTAAHIAGSQVAIAQGLGPANAERCYGRAQATIETQVTTALQCAIRLGLAKNTERLVRTWLRR
jgi:hypothetical protein